MTDRSTHQIDYIMDALIGKDDLPYRFLQTDNFELKVASLPKKESFAYSPTEHLKLRPPRVVGGNNSCYRSGINTAQVK